MIRTTFVTSTGLFEDFRRRPDSDLVLPYLICAMLAAITPNATAGSVLTLLRSV